MAGHIFCDLPPIPPQSPLRDQTYEAMGGALLFLNRNKEAISSLSTAITLNPAEKESIEAHIKMAKQESKPPTSTKRKKKKSKKAYNTFGE